MQQRNEKQPREDAHGCVVSYFFAPLDKSLCDYIMKEIAKKVNTFLKKLDNLHDQDYNISHCPSSFFRTALLCLTKQAESIATTSKKSQVVAIFVGRKPHALRVVPKRFHL